MYYNILTSVKHGTSKKTDGSIESQKVSHIVWKLKLNLVLCENAAMLQILVPCNILKC